LWDCRIVSPDWDWDCAIGRYKLCVTGLRGPATTMGRERRKNSFLLERL
jgi:hypothetical protein